MENLSAADEFDLKFDLIQKSLVKDLEEVIEIFTKKGCRVQRTHSYSGKGDIEIYRCLVTPKDYPDVHAVIVDDEDKVKFLDRDGEEIRQHPYGYASTPRRAWLDAARNLMYM